MRVHHVLLVILSVAVASPSFAAKKKSKEPPPPPVGEVKVGDWSCWAPTDFASLTESQRRIERQKGYDFAWKLISGDQRPGFKVEDTQDLDYFETAFLGRPTLLDTWLPDNYKRCEAVGKGEATPESYLEWLSRIGRELEKGQCSRPFDYEVHQFLDVQTEWQARFHVCKGDKFALISTGTDMSQWQLVDAPKGQTPKFVGAAGDPATPAAGDLGVVGEAPWGALIMRFEYEDGSTTKYIVAGLAMDWEAPDHGFISFAINDNTYFDNKFREVKGVKDYLAITLTPAKSEGTTGGGLP